MAFYDNPLIASLGNAVGLSPLFAGADGNSTPAPPTAAPPQQVKAPSTPPPTSEMHSPTRPYMPPRGLQPGANGAGYEAIPQMTGTASPEEYNDPQVQALLQHFGQSGQMPNVDPRLFVHGAFAQNHPHIADAIDGALSGAAFTQGSSTWGEGISNVARGMLESNQAHAASVNNQLAMPFHQAQLVGQLQEMKQQEDLRQAQTQEAGQRGNYYDQMGDYKSAQEADHLETANKMADIHQQIVDLQKQKQVDSETSPQGIYSKAIAQGYAELLAKHGGDATKIPSKDLKFLADNYMSGLSTAKSAGARSVKATVGGGTPGNGKIDPKDKERIGFLKDSMKQSMDDEKEERKSSVMVTGADGKKATTGTSAYESYFKQKYGSQRDLMQNEYDGLTKKYGVQPPRPAAIPQDKSNPY
jgi:hypothetical protein